MKTLFLCLIAGTLLTSCSKKESTDAHPNTPPKTNTETIPTLTPAAFVGNEISGSVDGTGTNAKFYQVLKLTSDKSGNIYVLEAVNSANYFYKIRKVTPSGIVSTLFNGGAETFVNNVPVEKTKIYQLIDIAADPSGNLYVLANMTDYSKGNAPGYYQEYGTYKLNTSTNNLDKISTSSTTSGGQGLISWVASYNLLNNIAIDANGNLYGAWSPGNITGIPSGGKIYKIVSGSGTLYANADAAYASTLIGDANGVLYASTPTDILKVTASGASSVFTFPISATAVRPTLIGNQSGVLYAYGDLFTTIKEFKGTGFYKIKADGTIGSKGIIGNSPNLSGVTTDTSGNIYYAVHLSTGGYIIYKVSLN